MSDTPRTHQHRPLSKLNTTVKGFSLIEALFSIAITALVASFAIPSFDRFSATLQVRDTTFQIRNFFTGAKVWAVKNHLPVLICASTDGTQCNRDWSGQLMMITDSNQNRTFDVGTDFVLRQEALGARHLNIRAGRNLTYYGIRRNGSLRILGDSIFICHPKYADLGLRVVLWRTGSYRITDKDSDGNPLSCPSS